MPEGFILPSSIKEIGTMGFMAAKVYAPFIIPSTVTKIGNLAFKGVLETANKINNLQKSYQ